MHLGHAFGHGPYLFPLQAFHLPLFSKVPYPPVAARGDMVRISNGLGPAPGLDEGYPILIHPAASSGGDFCSRLSDSSRTNPSLFS
jgi:hypothetical protein